MTHPLIGSLVEKSTEDLLKTTNELYKRIAFARRSGNSAMLMQLIAVLDTYQEEYRKRIQEEVDAAKKNPIFKDSLDIGD